MSKNLKNLRPLPEITADIYKADRQNIFTIGKLLREAKAHFPHGKWLPYLRSIDWSQRTAQFYMAIAELADKYATVAHLNAASSALYQLTQIAPDTLPLAIERLKQSVERKDSAAEQRLAVDLSTQAKLLEDDGIKVTELALQAASDAINQSCFGRPERMEAMQAQHNAIIKANPKTEEELKAVKAANPIPLFGYANQEDIPGDSKGRIVVDSTDDEDEVEEEEDEAEEETAPAPATELLPRQRALVGKFNDACEELLTLASKASTVFLHSNITVEDLDMLGNFLKQIAASKRNAAPDRQSDETGSGDDDDLTIPECLRRGVA
jgi:Protein of unknown function (DUF3102)